MSTKLKPWRSNCFICSRFLALGTNLFNYSALRKGLLEVLPCLIVYSAPVVLDWSFRTWLCCFSVLDVTWCWFSKVFPRVVACQMTVFGVSGSHTKASGFCTLPINVINEKIYLVLWLSFVTASLVSLVQLVHQALLLAPPLRPYIVPHLSPSSLASRQVIWLIIPILVWMVVIILTCRQTDWCGMVHMAIW